MSNDRTGRWPCKVPDCGMPVEGTVPIWLDLHEDGTWTVSATVAVGGVDDDSASISCTEGHDNGTTALFKSLAAFLGEALPG